MKDEKEKIGGSSFILHPSSFRYYQLTHDYLVHSIREWLTRKQKETRRGRAELRLAERAAVWNAKPENRHLPSLWEFLNIRLLTDGRKWTSRQQRMMSKAGRFHGIQFGLAAGLFVLLTLSGVAVSRRIEEKRQAEHIMESEEERGKSEAEAKRIAYATVNKLNS